MKKEMLIMGVVLVASISFASNEAGTFEKDATLVENSLDCDVSNAVDYCFDYNVSINLGVIEFDTIENRFVKSDEVELSIDLMSLRIPETELKQLAKSRFVTYTIEWEHRLSKALLNNNNELTSLILDGNSSGGISYRQNLFS